MREVRYRAAGGVVVDGAGRVLLLERRVRRGSQDVLEVRLPKGHIEQGESDVDAALREVREESGYQQLAILADLGSAENSFDSRGERIARDEHYYLMRLISNERGQPTAVGEEALFVPLWVPDLAQAEITLTYESERAFARRARAVYVDTSPAPSPAR